MSEGRESDRYVLSMETNAKDSLDHAIEHLYAKQERDLKYAVLHVLHGTELLLKARLAKVHPILLQENVDEERKPGKEPNTLSFNKLESRLKNVGVDLQADGWRAICRLRQDRNQIEHRDVNLEIDVVRDNITSAFAFLEKLAADELGIAFSDWLRPDTYRELTVLHMSYEERLQVAMEEVARLAAEPGKTVRTCEGCGEKTLVVPVSGRDLGQVECCFCGTSHYLFPCTECYRYVVNRWLRNHEDWLCCTPQCGVIDTSEQIEDKKSRRTHGDPQLAGLKLRGV